MPELKTYRIFISHAWKYNEDYYRLIDYLEDASNFKFHNYSVPEHDPVIANDKTKLKEELKKQIRPVGIVLILAGMYVSYSEWIQFEIDFALEKNKPIIGIKPWGSDKIPSAVTESADAIVGWNIDTIVQAIREYSL